MRPVNKCVQHRWVSARETIETKMRHIQSFSTKISHARNYNSYSLSLSINLFPFLSVCMPLTPIFPARPVPESNGAWFYNEIFLGGYKFLHLSEITLTKRSLFTDSHHRSISCCHNFHSLILIFQATDNVRRFNRSVRELEVWRSGSWNAFHPTLKTLES